MTTSLNLRAATLLAAVTATVLPVKADITAEKLGPMPDAKNFLAEAIVSADCRHVAIAVEDGTGPTLYSLFVDGTKKSTHAYIKAVSISADGNHVADWCADGDQWNIEVDGKVVGRFPKRIGDADQTPSPVLLSADGSHWAYTARTQNAWVLSQDGKESNPGGKIITMRLSPDGAHLIYAAELETGGQVAVVDGKRASPLQKSEQWVITDDAQHWACVADVEADLTAKPVNPRNVPYYGRVVIDGQGGDQVTARRSSPVFIEHGSHIAYSIGAEIVLDGASNISDDLVFATDFSPDGRHVAAVSGRSMGIGDGSGTPFVTYHLWKDGKVSAIGDSGRFPTSMSLSPDGTRVATVFDHVAVNIDGKANRDFRGVTNPIFSPDGKHFAYAGWKDRVPITLADLIVDGAKLVEYSIIRTRRVYVGESDALSPCRFSPDDSLTFMGVKDGNLYRVTWKP